MQTKSCVPLLTCNLSDSIRSRSLLYHLFTFSSIHLKRNIVCSGCSVQGLQSLKRHDRGSVPRDQRYSTGWVTGTHNYNNNDDEIIMTRIRMLMRARVYRGPVLIAAHMWTHFHIRPAPWGYYYPHLQRKKWPRELRAQPRNSPRARARQVPRH